MLARWRYTDGAINPIELHIWNQGWKVYILLSKKTES